MASPSPLMLTLTLMLLPGVDEPLTPAPRNRAYDVRFVLVLVLPPRLSFARSKLWVLYLIPILSSSRKKPFGSQEADPPEFSIHGNGKLLKPATLLILTRAEVSDVRYVCISTFYESCLHGPWFSDIIYVDLC